MAARISEAEIGKDCDWSPEVGSAFVYLLIGALRAPTQELSQEIQNLAIEFCERHFLEADRCDAWIVHYALASEVIGIPLHLEDDGIKPGSSGLVK
jgi:hypothetical protein